MNKVQSQDEIILDIENSPVNETPISNRDVEQEIKITELDIRKTELDIRKEELEGRRQDRLQRKAYADNIFTFLCMYMIIIFVIIFKHGSLFNSFELSDSVIVALITTTTANIIGIFVFVVRYLFNTPNGKDKSK